VLDDAGRQECVYEGRRAPVHDRRLSGVELDLEVVDSRPNDSGKDVLDGVDGDRILAKLRLALGKYRALGERRNDRAIGQIRPPKEDAGSGHCRPER
jgi:hypothetical protein